MPRGRDYPAIVGLRFQALVFYLRFYFVFRARKGAVGVLATYIADFLGCGKRDVSDFVWRNSARRPGAPDFQKTDLAHVGAEPSQDKNSLATPTEQKFTVALRPIPPQQNCGPRDAANQNGGGPDPRPAQNCDRLMAGQRPKYQSELHLGIRTLAGGSRAAYGDQTKGGRRRLGCLIGVPPPPLRSPFRVAQWPSEFTRKTAEGSLGGEAYAFGEMMGHMELLREFYATFVDIAPDMVGLGGGESLFTHLPNRGIGAEKNLACHSLDVNRSIGRENPADGLAKQECDVALRLGPTSDGLFPRGRFVLLRELRHARHPRARKRRAVSHAPIRF